MDLDTQRIRNLLDKRDEIDRELAAIFTGNGMKERKAQRCSVCEQEGHTARTCLERKE